MSFWQLFSKKKQASPKDEPHPYLSSMDMIKNQELYNSLTGYISTQLTSLNLAKVEILKTFNDDKGLLDSLVFSATAAPSYTRLKDRSANEFLGVCGSNAFGRAIYVAEMQNKLNKPISQFTMHEVEDIIDAFRYTSDYELGLKMISVEPNSVKHSAFTELIIRVANYYLKICSEPLEKENLRSYMQSLFNAGVTIIYQ
jgi:hypothetical protein